EKDSEDVIREILQLDDAEGVVFANMRQVGKSFSGVETPLFEEDVANDVISSPPSHDIPSPSQEHSSPPQQPQNTCSALTHRVKNLEHDKAAQKLEIIKLKARV
nr:hypothetical protein [Tanacetum cinerariifolium]